jgi:hypothetical protein
MTPPVECGERFRRRKRENLSRATSVILCNAWPPGNIRYAPLATRSHDVAICPTGSWRMHCGKCPPSKDNPRAGCVMPNCPRLHTLALFGRRLAGRVECLVTAGIQKPAHKREPGAARWIARNRHHKLCQIRYLR